MADGKPVFILIWPPMHQLKSDVKFVYNLVLEPLDKQNYEIKLAGSNKWKNIILETKLPLPLKLAVNFLIY